MVSIGSLLSWVLETRPRKTSTVGKKRNSLPKFQSKGANCFLIILFQGLNLQDLQARAQEEMIIMRQTTKSLNNLLQDFYEHGVMKRTASNGLILTVDKESLTKFYESEFAQD